MDEERIRRLAEHTASQHGNVTASQADRTGLTSHERRGVIRDGILERAGTHVLRSPFVERTAIGDLAALVLDCGDGAVASGPTAAALYEFDGFVLAPPFHVTIPRGRLVKRKGHRIHTTMDLDPIDRTLVRGIPVFAPPRALLDLSRFVSRPRLSVALDCALRDRITTEDLIHERIGALRSSGKHGVTKLLDVIDGAEVTRGGHSWLERRFLEICAGHRLPKPETQQVLADSKSRVVRVDFRFGTRVVVEVLGYRWHRGSRAQLSRDVERINTLVREGFIPLQFTYDHVTAQVDWVVGELRETLGLPSPRFA